MGRMMPAGRSSPPQPRRRRRGRAETLRPAEPEMRRPRSATPALSDRCWREAWDPVAAARQPSAALNAADGSSAPDAAFQPHARPASSTSGSLAPDQASLFLPLMPPRARRRRVGATTRAVPRDAREPSARRGPPRAAEHRPARTCTSCSVAPEEVIRITRSATGFVRRYARRRRRAPAPNSNAKDVPPPRTS